jgi:cytidyltransferase-related domain
MKQVGMYGGSFNPLHLGHVNDIVRASSYVDELYLILSVTDDIKEIDHRIRYMWLKQLASYMPNIKVIEIFDDSKGKDVYDWNQGRDDIIAAIGKPINVVFCGDDYKGTNRFESLYPNSEIHYFSRSEINISSTEIRNNPYQKFEYLPNIVKPYYTKKVMIVGTESCGKSTLVRNLGLAYNTTYVEEVGRDICEEAGGIDNMMPEHYEEILYKHKVREQEMFKLANKVLFIDTEALITLYYYKLQFGESDEYKEAFERLARATADLNKYDLWLYLEPDVKWVQDGTRTYGDDLVREQNNKTLKGILDELGIKYECIKGTYEERFIKSKELVDKMLR